LYLSFAISATIFSGTQSYILVISGIKQGRTIHKQVIKALLYTSLTKFYHRVPMGRILNRLSKDLR
jgi:ATP-binding cassette subfamily C (CFTR/MRP) protein 1